MMQFDVNSQMCESKKLETTNEIARYILRTSCQLIEKLGNEQETFLQDTAEDIALLLPDVPVMEDEEVQLMSMLQVNY